MDVAGKSGILSPELYEREKEKFQTLMEETRELATVPFGKSSLGLSGIWLKDFPVSRMENQNGSSHECLKKWASFWTVSEIGIFLTMTNWLSWWIRRLSVSVQNAKADRIKSKTCLQNSKIL